MANPPDTVSWAELAADAAHKLTGISAIEDPRHEARLIVEAACGADAGEWLLIRDSPATVRGVAAIDRMVARRSGGEPLQYVLGEWGFRHLNLLVDRRVLIPRPETESVVEAAGVELRRLGQIEQQVVVDLGTGSGAIGLAIAYEYRPAQVWLTDISDDALAVARANLAGLGMAGASVRVAQGSWFEALPGELKGTIGVVIANPPYVGFDDDLPPSVADWEPSSALYAADDGTADLIHLLASAGPWLCEDGVLVLELAPAQVDRIVAYGAQWFKEIEVGHDLAGRERWIVARRPQPL